MPSFAEQIGGPGGNSSIPSWIQGSYDDYIGYINNKNSRAESDRQETPLNEGDFNQYKGDTYKYGGFLGPDEKSYIDANSTNGVLNPDFSLNKVVGIADQRSADPIPPLLAWALPLLIGGGAAFGAAGAFGGEAGAGSLVGSAGADTLGGDALWSVGAGETGAFDMAGSMGTGLPGAGGAASGGFSWEDLLKRLVSPSMPGSGNNNGGRSGLSSAADILSGIYGLTQSSKLGNLAASGQAAAQRMTQLTADPSQVKNTPGYAELLKSRGDALSRRMAAQGYNLSGNERASLAELGGAQFSDYYAQEMDRLAKQTNASYAPAVGEQQMRANAINRLVYGGSRLIGG